jgi:hypothetical protein
MRGYEVVAFNTAVESDNKIHDDEVARRFGFRGGLVPGVDVYAYLTHPPAEAWGLDWLARGTMRARFAKPVYEGVRVVVEPVEQHDRWASLELRDADGELCATAEAALPERAPAPDDAGWPAAGQVATDARPPASPASLPPGAVFGLEPHGFHADRAGEYLEAVREPLPLYREAKVAHPGWLLRDANYVLARNVRLGPWIHVESSATHVGLVHDGQTVETRARVTREWEHKGHRFVTLDVGVLADGELAVRVEHTAIYAPRQVSSATT